MRYLLFHSLLWTFAFLAQAAAQSPAANRLLEVPDINGMAVSLVKPDFPEAAIDVDADGTTVSLRVIVDENGNAVSATCSLICHSMLKDAAEMAAIQSKFKPMTKEGRPVKYQGTLLYTFVVNRVDWFRFATAIESTRQFDNISLGPVAQILSPDFSKEKASLLTLDENGGADYNTRQKVIAEVVASVKAKLAGVDRWRFDLGLALRRITFWAQAGGPIDRVELQKAIDDLAANASSFPEGISDNLIKEISAISKYRIPPNISEIKLRRAILDLSRNITPHLK